MAKKVWFIYNPYREGRVLYSHPQNRRVEWSSGSSYPAAHCGGSGNHLLHVGSHKQRTCFCNRQQIQRNNALVCLSKYFHFPSLSVGISLEHIHYCRCNSLKAGNECIISFRNRFFFTPKQLGAGVSKCYSIRDDWVLRLVSCGFGLMEIIYCCST